MDVLSSSDANALPPTPRSRLGANSFGVLSALKEVLPDALIVGGRTGLPFLVMPKKSVGEDFVGQVKVFYNLTPRQFRIVDDSNPKYEFRCGTAREAVEELSSLYDEDYEEPQEIMSTQE